MLSNGSVSCLQTGRSHMVFLRKPTPFEAAARPDGPQADLNVIGGPGDAVHRGPEGTVAVELHNTVPDSDAVRPSLMCW